MTDKFRWREEISTPTPMRVVYLTEKALANLEYTLGHAVSGDDSLTLSEAVSLLCDDWIRLGNLNMWCERGHDLLDPEGEDDESSEVGDGSIADD